MPTPPPEPTAALSARLARAAPWLLAAYGGGLIGVGHITVESARAAAVLSVLSWAGFTALLALITAGLVALPLSRPWLLATTVVAACVWLGLSYGSGPRTPPLIGAVAMLAMIVAMASFGRVLVVWVVKEANLLPVVLVLMAGIDVWGVTVGFTAHVAEHAPEVIAKASAALPGVVSRHPSAFPLGDLSVGPGDILFMGLVLALAVREGFDLRRNLVWIYALTLSGLALVLATGWLIPGLVFIGGAGLIANWGRFEYTAAERRALAVAAVIVVPLLVVAGLAFRSVSDGTDRLGEEHGANAVRLSGD